MCEGGQTVVVLGDGTRFKSSATTTPGEALLFRKDMRHEGVRIKSGRKEILTFNLLALKKGTSSFNKPLPLFHVTFPLEEMLKAKHSGKHSRDGEKVNSTSLRAKSQEGSSYVLALQVSSQFLIESTSRARDHLVSPLRTFLPFRARCCSNFWPFHFPSSCFRWELNPMWLPTKMRSVTRPPVKLEALTKTTKMMMKTARIKRIKSRTARPHPF